MGGLAKGSFDGVRVLVIAMAGGGSTRATASGAAFTSEESQSISEWVRKGGSLLLVFDHFPNDAAVESLADEFGVKVGHGYVADQKEHTCRVEERVDTCDGELDFNRSNGLLRGHAITQGRSTAEHLNRVVTFGGSSLTAPSAKDEFLKLSPAATNRKDSEADPPVPPAPQSSQGAAFHFGQGRVVMLADSNTVAAQVVRASPTSIPTPTGVSYKGADNKQLVLNVLHWLSGLLD